MKGLTQKQREILEYIQNYIDRYQYSPSYRDIMNHFSLASPGSIYKYIQTLKRKGALIGEKQCSRSILPTAHESSKRTSELQIPYIGNIAVGTPLEMFIQSQMISVPSFLVPHPENTYILKSQGDSLNDEWIADGDLIIVEARQEAQAGDMIVGLINQNEVIVKRYFPEGHYIRLEGNSHHPLTIRAETLIIQGVIVGLLRSY